MKPGSRDGRGGGGNYITGPQKNGNMETQGYKNTPDWMKMGWVAIGNRRTIPHGTSQNLREKAPGNMHVIL